MICDEAGYREAVQRLEAERARLQTHTERLLLGLGQFDEYLSGLGLDTGWLVIFDQRKGQPSLAKRTRVEEATTPGGRTVAVVWG
ncbi:MAG: hypothetical protein Q8M65_02880 [Rhodoglobus sp.]|nr:hypothetical protein [Rhodoglobus sp.]